MPRLLLPLLALVLWLSPSTLASEPSPALDRLAGIAVQDGGRVMPLEGYARRLAVQLTGRTRWSASRGPEAFAGRTPVQLLCDLMFKGHGMLNAPLVAIENRPFKRLIGLEEKRRFFSASELAMNKGLNDLLAAFTQARQADNKAQPTRDQRRALDVRNAVERIAGFASGETLAIVPGNPYLRVGLTTGDPGTETVRAALVSLGQAYTSGAPIDAAVAQLQQSIDALGRPEPRDARSVKLELFYDRHNPWVITATLYGLSIVLFGFSRLILRRPLIVLAVLVAAAGVIEHFVGIGLRTAILHRAPVSNTYEALLWMGLVGIAIGLVAQVINRRAWYLFAGLGAAMISVLFAALVPLEDRTNALPAVLRSNFWLIIHVLTIVASYGVLAVGAVLGHAYLASQILFARKVDRPTTPRPSHPLIVQTYRTIQIGLILLTAGTILGGVWAADSWGRFWGWDPKETWALISCVVYFAVLHARYVRWLQDFGMAASAILGFIVIVWTFYGVNYVMATGLHSYGFGSGGEIWVALWAVAEIVFLVACRIRYSLAGRGAPAAEPAPKLPRAAGQTT